VWYLGMSNYRVALLQLESGTKQNSGIISSNCYLNFITKLSTLSTRSSDAYSIAWYVSADNYIQAVVQDDELRLRVREGGVNTDKVMDMAIADNDVVDFVLQKENTHISLIAYINKDYSIPYLINATTTIIDEAPLIIGYNSSSDTIDEKYSFSVSEINHAYHADIAEVSKIITLNPSSGAITADELTYGEFRLDKSNNRLYTKYSDTEVIYFTGTVV